MPRSGSFFVALCMVTIATSVATLAFLVANVAIGASAAIGFALLLAMVIGHLGAQRSADRAAIDARLAELTRLTSDTARDLAELSRRVDLQEAVVVDKAKAAIQPIVEEMSELGALVKQFAETLQAHEAAIVKVTAGSGATGAAAPASDASEADDTDEAADGHSDVLADASEAPAKPAAPAAAGRAQAAAPGEPGLAEVFAGLSRPEAVAVIERAIASSRNELYLQPIVTLPQRKVRWYQASVRLRSAEGDQIEPADYLELAETGGLMPTLDTETLSRCIQVAKRLTARNRDVGLVVNLSASSLADTGFTTEFITQLEANRNLAGALVFALRQEAVRQLSPLDIETMTAATERGFRFAISDVVDLRVEPRSLAERGFRQIKVSAELVLSRATEAGASIHPADLTGLFARHGIDLVVEGVENEPMVVDLLDYDVKFAQGPLFSPPRPVRAEVLADIGSAPVASPSRGPRKEARAETRTFEAPQSLGAAALAVGALAGGREPRRSGGIGQGLRALIRERS